MLSITCNQAFFFFVGEGEGEGRECEIVVVRDSKVMLPGAFLFLFIYICKYFWPKKLHPASGMG